MSGSRRNVSKLGLETSREIPDNGAVEVLLENDADKSVASSCYDAMRDSVVCGRDHHPQRATLEHCTAPFVFGAPSVSK